MYEPLDYAPCCTADALNAASTTFALCNQTAVSCIASHLSGGATSLATASAQRQAALDILQPQAMSSGRQVSWQWSTAVPCRTLFTSCMSAYFDCLADAAASMVSSTSTAAEPTKGSRIECPWPPAMASAATRAAKTYAGSTIQRHCALTTASLASMLRCPAGDFNATDALCSRASAALQAAAAQALSPAEAKTAELIASSAGVPPPAIAGAVTYGGVSPACDGACVMPNPSDGTCGCTPTVQRARSLLLYHAAYLTSPESDRCHRQPYNLSFCVPVTTTSASSVTNASSSGDASSSSVSFFISEVATTTTDEAAAATAGRGAFHSLANASEVPFAFRRGRCLDASNGAKRADGHDGSAACGCATASDVPRTLFLPLGVAAISNDTVSAAMGGGGVTVSNDTVSATMGGGGASAVVSYVLAVRAVTFCAPIDVAVFVESDRVPSACFNPLPNRSCTCVDGSPRTSLPLLYLNTTSAQVRAGVLTFCSAPPSRTTTTEGAVGATVNAVASAAGGGAAAAIQAASVVAGMGCAPRSSKSLDTNQAVGFFTLGESRMKKWSAAFLLCFGIPVVQLMVVAVMSCKIYRSRLTATRPASDHALPARGSLSPPLPYIRTAAPTPIVTTPAVRPLSGSVDNAVEQFHLSQSSQAGATATEGTTTTAVVSGGVRRRNGKGEGRNGSNSVSGSSSLALSVSVGKSQSSDTAPVQPPKTPQFTPVTVELTPSALAALQTAFELREEPVFIAACHAAHFPGLAMKVVVFAFQGFAVESLGLFGLPEATPLENFCGLVGCLSILSLLAITHQASRIAAVKAVKEQAWLEYRSILPGAPRLLRWLVVPSGFWFGPHPHVARFGEFFDAMDVSHTNYATVHLTKAVIVAIFANIPTHGDLEKCKALMLSLATIFFVYAVMFLALQPHRKTFENLGMSLLTAITGALALSIALPSLNVDVVALYNAILYASLAFVVLIVVTLALEVSWKRAERRHRGIGVTTDHDAAGLSGAITAVHPEKCGGGSPTASGDGDVCGTSRMETTRGRSQQYDVSIPFPDAVPDLVQSVTLDDTQTVASPPTHMAHHTPPGPVSGWSSWDATADAATSAVAADSKPIATPSLLSSLPKTIVVKRKKRPESAAASPKLTDSAPAEHLLLPSGSSPESRRGPDDHFQSPPSRAQQLRSLTNDALSGVMDYAANEALEFAAAFDDLILTDADAAADGDHGGGTGVYSPVYMSDTMMRPMFASSPSMLTGGASPTNRRSRHLPPTAVDGSSTAPSPPILPALTASVRDVDAPLHENRELTGVSSTSPVFSVASSRQLVAQWPNDEPASTMFESPNALGSVQLGQASTL